MEEGKLSFEELEFGGGVLEIAEKEFGASLGGDDGEKYISVLYRRYLRDGKPKRMKYWIREYLKLDFKCVSEKPKWNGVPEWQWHEGTPMIFVLQYNQFEQLSESLGVNYSIYVFAKKVDVEVFGHQGWSPFVKTITQAFQ